MEDNKKPLVRIEEPVKCVYSKTGYHNIKLLLDENNNIKYLTSECIEHSDRETLEGLHLLGSENTCFDKLATYRQNITRATGMYAYEHVYPLNYLNTAGKLIAGRRGDVRTYRNGNPAPSHEKECREAKESLSFWSLMHKRLSMAAARWYPNNAPNVELVSDSGWVGSESDVPPAYNSEKHGTFIYRLRVAGSTVGWYTTKNLWVKRQLDESAYTSLHSSNYGSNECFYCKSHYDRIARHNPSANHARGVDSFISHLMRATSRKSFRNSGRLLHAPLKGLIRMEERASARAKAVEEERKAAALVSEYTSTDSEIFMD